MKKYTFKIYTSQHSATTVGNRPKRSQSESKIFLLFFYIGTGVVAVFRFFMDGVIRITTAIRKFLSQQGNQTILVVNKRLTIISSKNFKKSLAVFLLLCLGGFGTFKSFNLFAKALDYKNTIFSGTQMGIDHLNQAQQALADQNIEAANSQFSQAAMTFSTAKQQLFEDNSLLSGLIGLLPQTREAKDALDAAALISQAGQELSNFYSLSTAISFSPQGLESSQDIPKTINSMGEALTQATQKVTEADQKISGVDISLLPRSKQQEFTGLSNKLHMAKIALENVQQTFTIAKQLSIPSSSVLVLFENNNELRPGGGFIGTFGNFAMAGGKINNLTISSIYDPDGQLKKEITPPQPLLAVNNRWYLRDSNWFADFSESAKKASDFFELEGGQTPDTVIALTPNVITSLLEVTGPVTIPTFNVSLNADNFVEQTQAISTISDNMPLNTPKEILADFFPLFLQKLKTIPKNQYSQILNALFENLQNKQLVVFSRDTTLEQQLDSFNWAGKISPTDRDYLEMISSNLGGTKTDLSLKKNLLITTTIKPDGGIVDDLTLTVVNQMPKMNETENLSFVRFLVPKGAKLLQVTGFDNKDLPVADQTNYDKDPQVTAWEQGMVRDVASGTYIGTESDKTFFGNWLQVVGGQQRTVHLIYQLPFTLQSLDRYSLTMQKQIGSLDDTYTYTVKFSGKSLDWSNFIPDSVEADSLKVSGLINKDMFFGMVFENR